MQSNTAPDVNLPAGAFPALATLTAAVAATKAGWRTSEFWITLAGFGGTVISGLDGALPAQWAAVIAPVIALCYHILRASAKDGERSLLVKATQAVLDHLTELGAPREILPVQATDVVTADALAAHAEEMLAHQVTSHAEVVQALAQLTVPRTLEAALAGKSTQEIFTALQKAGIPVTATVKPPGSIAGDAAALPPLDGRNGFIRLPLLASLLGCLAVIFLFGGCAAASPLKARLISLAHADGKQIIRIIGGAAELAAEAETQALNARIEAALK